MDLGGASKQKFAAQGASEWQCSSVDSLTATCAIGAQQSWRRKEPNCQSQD